MNAAYTPAQAAAIRRAVAAGREALRRARDYSPLRFARAYIESGGVQPPGRPDDGASAQDLSLRILAALEGRGAAGDDADLRVELRRIHAETAWARAAASDKVVGFRLQLSDAAAALPVCAALAAVDHGLGAAVFRKAEIVILPPQCDGRFIPVGEDEVEQ